MGKGEDILNIATKRGFFFPSGEIYKEVAGFWTYGHLGTLMKRKFEDLWRDYFLKLNENFFEIEDVNILSKDVFKNSGHLDHFTDPLTECKKCHFRFRADELIEDEMDMNVGGLKEKELDNIIVKNKLKCPKCGGELDKIKFFNMMFDLRVGATGKDVMYLRPETAQSPYISFKREFLALREKLPLGLAVVGKAFRNEISPRQGFFRLREFTQAELQIFFDPDDFKVNLKEVKNYKLKIMNKEVKVSDLKVDDFYKYYLAKVQKFYLDVLKIPKDKFRFRELKEGEKAFYNRIHYDVELNIDTLKGWKEFAGVHYRGDYDLKNHKVVVNVNGKKIIPNVLELSFGVDRHIWGLLDIFYKKEKERELFKLNRNVAPIEVAIFPLVNKDKLPEKAIEVYALLKEDFNCFYDSKGSIGKMYRRMDEVGCSCMITVDHQILKDNTVTLRDRDSMKQIRVKVSKLKDVVGKFLDGEKLNKLGKLIN
ncbi:MAG: glycine--tRNA ligase [Nanoarchaeota archaeon]|nr:glycine--tRNA ligase [Nanoarchaeota archaeon]